MATFNQQTGNNNPFDNFDVGTSIAPVLADIDGDGDLDAVVGRSNGEISYLRNDGSTTNPQYTLITNNTDPFRLIDQNSRSAPALGDIDGDGDLELLVGDNNGSLSYYERGSTTYQEQTGNSNPFNGFNVGYSSAPIFADLDGDGLLDLVVGEFLGGDINYFRNNGTATSPNYIQLGGSSNPFNGIGVGIASAPTLGDVDGDGDLDAIVGERDGFLNYFENTGSATAAEYVERTGTDNPFNNINLGSETHPALADVDGDGDLDVVVGELDGVLNYFERAGTGPNAADDTYVINLSQFGEFEDITANVTNASGNGADTAGDGTTLTVTAVNGAAMNVGQTLTLDSGASLRLNASGIFTYDPNDQFSGGGTDTFTYAVSNGVNGTATATVTVILNLTPVAQNDGNTSDFATDEDTAFTTGSVLANDSDPNGDTLTVASIDTSSTTGTVTDNGDGTFDYDPNGQFDSLTTGETATDTFTYTLSDGNGGTATATVTVTINGVEDDPVAQDDGDTADFTTDENTTFTTGNVLANDSDAEGDPFTLISFDTTGTVGIVTDNGDGTFDYDPNGQFDDLAAGETDTDTFTYTISDGDGDTATATVTITLTGVPDGATTFVVTTLADEDFGGGSLAEEQADGNGLSLREAIALAEANNNDAIATDTIVFAGDIAAATGVTLLDANGNAVIGDTGTIFLTNGELVIDSSVIIDGDRTDDGIPDITIDAQGNSRVFNIDDGDTNTDTTVEIAGLTITGGNVTAGNVNGGGISNTENLTLTNSTLRGNTASFGGGIANTETLAIDNSEIAGNSVRFDGGGIHNASDGIVTVSNSVISGNSASDDGGGVHNFGDSTVTVINSTIAGNSANDNGGGLYSQGSATVGNSTITGNTAGDDGGGIAVYTGATIVSNSIVSGNTATDAGNELSSFGSGTVTVDGNNLLGSSESTFNEAFNGVTPGASDIVATSDNSSSATHDPTALANILEVDGQGDPLLQDNGGLTETVALVSGSPAINAGDNANIPADLGDQDGDGDTAEDTPFDQRGTDFDRISGPSIDIGAFERQNPTVTLSVSPTTASEADTTTLTLTVTASEEVSGSQTVALDFSGTGITADDFDSAIPDTLTIADGETTASVTVDIADDTVLEDEETATFAISNPSSGLALGTTTTVDVVIADNDNQTIVVDTLVDENDGDLSAGDISLREALAAVDPGGTITFANSLLTADNGFGTGVIGLDGTQLTIAQSVTIDGDINSDDKGDITLDAQGNSRVLNINDGVNNSEIEVSLSGLTITGGSASDTGGGIYNRESLAIANSTITGNSTSEDGGGIFSENSITIANSMISGNYTETYGAGIFINSGNSAIVNSTISGNSASNSGGGIVIFRSRSTIFSSAINENLSSNGGGIFNFGGTITIANSTISGNSATGVSGDGGGIYDYLGNSTIVNSTISGNSASNLGGGIYNYGSTSVIANSIVAGNTASSSNEIFVDFDGIIDADANNLFGDSSQTNDEAFDGFDPDVTGTSDIIATSNNSSDDGGVALSDILNSTLTDNGGPTLTLALVDGSPAIDAGNDDNIPADLGDQDGDGDTAEDAPFDQRGDGFDRVQGIAVDIGAFEVINTPPIAQDDGGTSDFTTDEDTAFTTGNVLANDTDAEGDTLTVISIDTTGTLGTVTDNGDGTFDYAPNGQFESLAVGETATDTFDYTISDGNGGTATATVTITINGVNDAPVAQDDVNIPTYIQQTGANNPFNGIAVGSYYSAPTFADVDGDGDLDAVVGERDGTLNYYENTGSATAPAYTQRTGTDNPFNGIDVGTNSTPTFADVDGDGDLDAVVGAGDGTLNYYENTGSATAPAYTQRTGTDNPFNGIDVGTDSAPTFADVDGDGDLDAVVGEFDRTLNYYENTGSATAPAYIQQTGTDNPFNGIDVELYSAPTFADVDGDGDLDAVVGEIGDNLNYFENSGSATAPAYTQQTGTDNPFNKIIDVGGYTKPTFADVDGDGDLDAVVGAIDGTLNYFKNSSSFFTNEDTAFTTGNVLTNDSDPEGDSLTVISINTTGTLGTVINNDDGTFDYDPNGQFEDLTDGETATDTFTYTISDGNGGTDTATVTITISGATDNTAPTITSTATANAAENQTFAIDVAATDDADTEGNGLTYSITDGADAALFSIDADTGEITFDAAPDFETPGNADGDNVYDLQVTVTDSSGLTDVQDIAITVTDVDENSAPTITSAATANAAENQTVAIDVEATDNADTEGAGLTYSITDGADAALFSIDADTGEVTFDAAPDFENPGDAGGDNVYDLQVTVTDSSGLTDVQDIAITVTDVDENSAPTITSAATANAAENQTVAIDVEATDDADTEGAGLTYSITDGADATLFSIDADTGEVTFDAAPDFETPGDAGTDNVYDLQVTVTDSSGLTDVQDIAITVTDVDENSAPTITSTATANAAENQTVAIDVAATDDADTEGNGLTYSITDGADAALFSIDADTGEVTFDAAPDFENPGDAGGDNVYDLQVTVTDSSGFTDVQDIAITVTDVDETASNGFLFSVNTNTRVDGVTYTEQDILQFDGTEFSLFFDGSNVLPGGFEISAFDVISDTEILFSFAQPFSLDDGEVIDDSDIVKFTTTSLGSNTAGSFSLYFDGSDVGLSAGGEDIDALVGLPDGSLLLSTTANVNVPGVSARDEDVLLFSPTSLGSDTAGSFSVFFDGSDVGLGDVREDVDALGMDAAGDLFFSNTRNFSVPGLSGQDEDVFAYTPSSTGSVTTGTFASELFFDGSQDGGFSTDIKGIDLTFTQI